jgi:transketolase
VEEHYIPGGLGSMVCEVCAANTPVPVKMLGIPKSYAGTGPYKELMASYNLDRDGIVRSVMDVCEGR